MEALLAAYEQPIYRYRAPLVRAMLADLEGRFAEADALSREALSIIEEHRIAGGMFVFTSQRIGFLHTRGDTDGWSDVEPIVLGAYENGDRMLAIYRCMFECMFERQKAVRASLAMAMDRLRAMPDAVSLAAACALAKISEHAQVFYDLVASELSQGSWQFGPGRVTSVGRGSLRSVDSRFCLAATTTRWRIFPGPAASWHACARGPTSRKSISRWPRCSQSTIARSHACSPNPRAPTLTTWGCAAWERGQRPC
jgi:hypothetical protein